MAPPARPPVLSASVVTGLVLLALLLYLPGCAGTRTRLAEGGTDLGHRATVAWHDPERLQVPHGVEAHRVHGPLVYVVPVDGGVVLVDTGFDHSGAQLRAVAGERPILAVLITHLHLDHVAGASRLGVPVYAGAVEARRWHAQAPSRALLVRVAERLVEREPVPPDLRAVDDGGSVELGGARFTAYPAPGHTPGSTVWLWRDVLFTGDAAVSLDARTVRPPFAAYTDRPRQCWPGLRRLLDVEFEVICDGHYGCTGDAREKLRRSLHEAGQRPCT